MSVTATRINDRVGIGCPASAASSSRPRAPSSVSAWREWPTRYGQDDQVWRVQQRIVGAHRLGSVTSSAARRSCPCATLRQRLLVDDPARAVLIRIALDFIRLSAAASIRCGSPGQRAVEADEVTSCQQFCERRRARREHIHRKALGAARDRRARSGQSDDSKGAPCNSAPFIASPPMCPTRRRTSARSGKVPRCREHQRKRKVAVASVSTLGVLPTAIPRASAASSRHCRSDRVVGDRSQPRAAAITSASIRSLSMQSSPRRHEASDQLLTRRRGITRPHFDRMYCAQAIERLPSTIRVRKILASSGFSRNLGHDARAVAPDALRCVSLSTETPPALPRTAVLGIV